jgi:hypothetical protein
MLNRTILAAFLAASAIALDIDPAVARRMAESRTECSTRDMREHRCNPDRLENSGCAVRLRRGAAKRDRERAVDLALARSTNNRLTRANMTRRIDR